MPARNQRIQSMTVFGEERERRKTEPYRQHNAGDDEKDIAAYYRKTHKDAHSGEGREHVRAFPVCANNAPLRFARAR